MMIHENLKGRVAVVTGGGGVLCADFAKTLAKQGVKVAVLDINAEAAKKVADEITADGGAAVAVGCNVLEKESMEKAREIVNRTFGTRDILLNGAGGNNPKGTTTKETLEKIDLIEKNEAVKTFFDLDPQGISFVFNLNFLGTLIPTARYSRAIWRKREIPHCDDYFDERLPSAHENSRVFGGKGGGEELYRVYGGAFR